MIFVDLKRTKKRTVFVRTSEVIEYKKYAELLDKVSDLEKRLTALRSQEVGPFLGYDKAITHEIVKIIDTRRKHTSLEIKLATAFLVASDAIMLTSIEDEISRRFPECVNKIPSDTNTVSKVPLTNEGLALFRTELFCRNLIELTEDKRGRVWTFTDYGRKQFALLRSIDWKS
jgi:hypothetical protein